MGRKKGSKFSKETRKKMSIAYWKWRENNPPNRLKLPPLSEEHKQKIRKANLGKKF